MKTRRIGSAAVVIVIASTAMMMGAGTASAHTPSVSASCSGVRLVGTAYDSGVANRWTATVDGKTTSGTFGATLDQVIPVPQGGATTSWSATIEAFDGSYRQSRSGTVGPCGKPPVPEQPADEVEVRERTMPPDCTTFTVTTVKESRVTPYVYDKTSNSWVPGAPGEWKQTDRTTREASLQECPAPPRPEPISDQKIVEHQDCGDSFATVTTTTTTTGYVLDEPTRTWSLGEPVVASSSIQKPTAKVDCPTPVVDRHDVTPVLPDTGAPAWWYAAAAGLLVVSGATILLVQRRSIDWD